MAIQLIGVGAAANDGTGDQARTAFTKVNANFTELYAGAGSIPIDALPDGSGNVLYSDIAAIENDPTGTKVNEKVTLQQFCLAGLKAPQGTLVTVAMADAVAGATVGGALKIATGAGNGANGGDLTITTGNATGASGKAGVITITGGTGVTGGAPTTWAWTASKGGLTGAGSTWTIKAGPGGATSGAGGQMNLQGGAPIDGNGGAVGITGAGAATTTSTSRNGGGVSIACGASVLAGTGGSYATTGGQGGTTGVGGSCSFIAGTGGSTSGNGGGVSFTGGASASGNGGDVTFTPGATLGGGANGVIKLQDSAATTVLTVDVGKATLSAPVIGPGYTVATLPAGVQYARAFVNDALAPVFGAAVAGGGAVTVPVYYTGAAWFVG
jgi:hypothetical protein